MRVKIYLLAILALILMSFHAPVKSVFSQSEVGKVYKIQVPKSKNFDHIDLPHANFVRKMGGFLSIEDLHEMEVRIKHHNPESGKSKLERVDGKKFFNAVPVLHAEVEHATTAGELKEKN